MLLLKILLVSFVIIAVTAGLVFSYIKLGNNIGNDKGDK